MGHRYELGVVAANQIRRGLHVDAAFDLVWCSQNLHPQSCLEGEKLDLVAVAFSVKAMFSGCVPTSAATD